MSSWWLTRAAYPAGSRLAIAVKLWQLWLRR
jgi:hypothetical protein